MTPCGYDYFRALANPFDLDINPCIPGLFPTPSMKYKITTRGTFQVGTQGVGGVAMWPLRGAFSDMTVVGTAQQMFLAATNSTYARTDYDFLNSHRFDPAVRTDLNLYAGSTSMFTAAAFGNLSNRSIKLVAAGLRVQYVDKVLDMSGNYVTFRNPAPSSSIDASIDTPADLLRVNAADFRRVGEGYVGVAYRPLLETDTMAVPDPGYSAVMGSTNFTARLAGGVLVTNAQAGARFAFESVAFYEAYGPGLATTPSHSDPHTLGIVISSDTGTLNPVLSANEREQWAQIVSTVRDLGYSGARALGHSFASGVGNALTSAGSSLVRGVASALQRRARGRPPS